MYKNGKIITSSGLPATNAKTCLTLKQYLRCRQIFLTPRESCLMYVSTLFLMCSLIIFKFFSLASKSSFLRALAANSSQLLFSKTSTSAMRLDTICPCSSSSNSTTILMSDDSSFLMLCCRLLLYLLLQMFSRLRADLWVRISGSSMNYWVNLILLQVLDSFSMGLQRDCLRVVNQLDSSFFLMWPLMLLSTFSTFSMDWSMAYCSAMISLSLPLLISEACSIIPITLFFSSLVATILCSLSEYCSTNSLGLICISQLAVAFWRSSSLGQQQFSMRRQMLLSRLATRSSGFLRVSLMNRMELSLQNCSPSCPTVFDFFYVLSISTNSRNYSFDPRGRQFFANQQVSSEEELQSTMKPTYSEGSTLAGLVITSKTAMKISRIMRFWGNSLLKKSLASFWRNSMSWVVLREGWWQTPIFNQNSWLLFINIIDNAQYIQSALKYLLTIIDLHLEKHVQTLYCTLGISINEQGTIALIIPRLLQLEYLPLAVGRQAQIFALNEDLKRHQSNLGKMEHRYQQLKKLMKVISERVGFDSNKFLSERTSEIIAQQNRADYSDQWQKERQPVSRRGQAVKMHIIRKYHEARKQGMTLTQYCQLNNLAENIVRRWVFNK